MSLPCIRHTISPEGLFGTPIKPFGLLVGIGLLVGFHMGRRRARELELDEELCSRGMFWTVVSGFVVAHLVSVVLYFPEDLLRDPLVLLKFWKQISSFGGFIGGVLGAYIFFKVKYRVSLLAYSEPILYGLVFGWIFGRMGCTTVHDHPGIATDFFMGVRCGPSGTVVHDLGLYELLYTIVIAGIVHVTRKKMPFPGFHGALVLLLYSPVRFLFDFLRVEDRTYFGVTPGQFFSLATLLGAVALAAYGLRLQRAGISPVAAEAAAFKARSNASKNKRTGKGRKKR